MTHETLLLFGSPRILHADGREEALAWKRPAMLLAYLGSRPGWHRRDALAVALRPDATAASGRSYLRRLLHRIREDHPGMTSLTVEDDRVRWDGECDVRAFEAAVSHGDWDRAIRLQREPFLARVGSADSETLDEWFDEKRAQLRARLGAVYMDLIRQQHRAGADCSLLLRSMAALDPLDENAIQFILAHARGPSEAQVASDAYRTFSERIAAEYAHVPLPETQALHTQLLQGRAAREEEAAATTGLPTQAQEPAARAPAPASIIPLGREAELRRIAALLDDPSVRLVSIVGLGGVGKTVLARAAFEARRSAPGVGCCWVDLAAAANLQEMLDAVAGQVGVPPGQGPMERQLERWLAPRRCTVFLDNFEHLGAHVEVLQRLLDKAPGLVVVATSREPLRLGCEHLVLLSGLGREAAVELFGRHCARLGHVLTARERHGADELVAYLDGLPLAIELAAYWVTLVVVDHILPQLRADPTLVDAAAQASGRGSVWGVFEQAWSRLPSQERQALAGLALTADVFDLEAARVLTGSDGTTTLLSLAQRSLVQRRDGDSFRIHPLLKEFVRSRTDADTLASARARYVDHFLGTLAHGPKLGIGQLDKEVLATFLRKVADHANAWRMAADAGDFKLMGSALRSLGIHLVICARHEECADLMEYGAARIDPSLPLYARVQAFRAGALLRLARLREAESMAHEVLALHPAGPHRCLLHLILAKVYRTWGRFDDALACSREALATCPDVDPGMLARCLEDVGESLLERSEFGEAESYFESAIAAARTAGANRYVHRSQYLLAELLGETGHHDAAASLLASSLDFFANNGDPFMVAACRRAIARLDCRRGRGAEAKAEAKAALDLFEANGFAFEVGESLYVLGRAMSLLGDPAAVIVWRDALRHARELGDVPLQSRCIGALGPEAAGSY